MAKTKYPRDLHEFVSLRIGEIFTEAEMIYDSDEKDMLAVLERELIRRKWRFIK